MTVQASESHHVCHAIHKQCFIFTIGFTPGGLLQYMTRGLTRWQRLCGYIDVSHNRPAALDPVPRPSTTSSVSCVISRLFLNKYLKTTCSNIRYAVTRARTQTTPRYPTVCALRPGGRTTDPPHRIRRKENCRQPTYSPSASEREPRYVIHLYSVQLA